MDKKRSIGVTIFAIIGLIFSGILSFVTSLFYIYGSFKAINDSFVLVRFGAITSQILLISFIQFFVAIGLIIASLNLFKLKEWSRKLFLCLNTVLFFLVSALNPRITKFTKDSIIELAISSIYYLVFIYFFTRPKVKEQFK